MSKLMLKENTQPVSTALTTVAPITPMEMLSQAVSNGAGIEVLEKRPATWAIRPVSPEEIIEWLSYDPEAGIVSWKKKPNRNKKIGSPAGYLFDGKERGKYIRIGFRGKTIFAHVAAFVCMTGRYPIEVIDHVDGNTLNNCWSNLREVKHKINLRNQRRHRGEFRVSGIDYHAQAGKWRARIGVDGKMISLGLFTNFGEAIAARRSAEEKHWGSK